MKEQRINSGVRNELLEALQVVTYNPTAKVGLPVMGQLSLTVL